MKRIAFLIILLLNLNLNSQTSEKKIENKLSNKYNLDQIMSQLDSSNARLNDLVSKAKKANAETVIPIMDSINSSPTKVNSQYYNASQAKVVDQTVYYTVELHSTVTKLPNGHVLYKKFPNMEESYEYGMYRYLVGKYSTEEKAEDYVDFIKEKGHMGTIIKFKDGKRVIMSN